MRKFEYKIVYFVQDTELEDFGVVLGESYSDALKNLENIYYYGEKRDNIIEIKITESELDDYVISFKSYFSYCRLTTEEKKEE